ncbi:MAG: M56 family metallopeptidase, partial [Phycisphaerae bacterium]|nr:M56 family metallopeptidase [Phycisphaerae bacterium]
MQFEHLVHIFASPNWERLMLTLLHSLWQAPILASVVYVSLKAVPVRRANTRYGICLAGLLMTVVASLATWSILGLEMFSCTADSQATMMPLASHTPLGSSQKSAHSSDSSANSGKSALNTPVVWNAEQSNQDTATSEAYQQAVSQSVAGTADTGAAGKPFPWSAILAAGWLIGMVVMFVRLILIVTGAHRLKKQGRPVNNPELLAVIEQLRQLFGIRRSIRVLVGNALSSPAVAGLFWPTLLLPASMLTGTPAEAWLPILAHELTHIRRYDALVDLLQLMIETVLFFNPAVWWMSRQIRIEREACCDAMAVAITGEPLNYTRILADLAERTLLQSSTLSAMTSPLPATTAAFAGGGRQPLLDRAKRLLLPNYRPPMRLSWTVFGLALLVGVALFAGLWRGTS